MTAKQYKITSFDEVNGQIVAEVEGFQPMAIDLPLVDGAYPIGDALDTFVMGFFPSYVTQRRALIASGVENSSVIAAMVETVDEQRTPEDVANQEMWANIEFEKQVSKVLVKFGVLSEDPTTINTTTL